ncbi:hypothetical protein IAU60_000183 [Kwoniella sp. DSM 27419]
METPTTDNYFTVAQADDRDAERQAEASGSCSMHGVSSIGGADQDEGGEEPEVPVLDKAEVRRQRIAAAVERSRTEYKAEHAYTEREWFLDDGTGRCLKPKKDRQQLEYITTALYHANPPEYRSALDLILALYDPDAKSLAGLTRELIDIGIRAALGCGDTEAALKLVGCSKSLWKGQFAGLSVLAADVYLAAGRPKDAMTPLLLSLANHGLHGPVLDRLGRALRAILYTAPSDQQDSEVETSAMSMPATTALADIVDRAEQFRGQYLSKPLYNVEQDGLAIATSAPPTDPGLADPVDLDAVVQELSLDADQRKGLEGTWSRLSKGLKGDADAVPEKSVRDL